MVSSYLMGHLQTRSLTLRKQISLEEAGAAIERTHIVVAALAFYESVIRDGWAGDEKEFQFARERWVKCKDRQVSVTMSRERQRQIRAEADERAKQWKIVPSELPEYPEDFLDSTELLKKLDDLYKAGVLEDEEFEEKRQKILSRR